MAVLLATLALAGLAVGGPASAHAAEPVEPIPGQQVEIRPVDDARVEWGRAHLTGTIRVAAHPGGLGLTEELDPERYLLGLQEVPFSWPREALAAQAVAARTYLAWTLARGRSSTGRAYGYDICATTACQVYGGATWVDGPGGDRWRRAVSSTEGEILLYQGEPAQALYSSTSGGRTRSVEDVFGGEPIPYLRAVPSPGEASPFVDWVFRVDATEMAAMLDHAGLVEGELVDVTTEVTDDGEGPWRVVVEGTAGTRRVGTWQLRVLLNRAAAELYPDRFPARRPDGSGRRYPQTVLSPTYTITSEEWWVIPPGKAPRREIRYRVAGHGWGHLVGMSQYGAEAMARRGATYAEILAHYYGGFEPSPAGEWLPDTIVVGLEAGSDTVELRPLGPVDVLVDGEAVAEGVVGSWRFESVPGGLLAIPAEGMGAAPRVGSPAVWFGAGGRIDEVRVATTAPGEVRVVVTVDGGVVGDSGWMMRDAGVHSLPWEELVEGGRPPGALVVTASVRSPAGTDEASVRVLTVPRRSLE